MQQYLELLRAIKERGSYKAPARENMPGSKSLFGYQFRHDLQKGFPILTTKKVNWKAVVVELLWFLRGDTNIKYLVDNGVNIWNEDAYNYHCQRFQEGIKKAIANGLAPEGAENLKPMPFDIFIEEIKKGTGKEWLLPGSGYRLGDCGFQYGKVWRKWEKWKVYEGDFKKSNPHANMRIFEDSAHRQPIDQIGRLIDQLRSNPESRRHIVTAIDPAHDTELALYWCHAMFQFNCRPIEYFEGDGAAFGERGRFYRWVTKPNSDCSNDFEFCMLAASSKEEIMDTSKYPKYYLDCQLYQRSADVVLGVPFNIASYSLLTHIIAKICNMVPGEFIHSFGDVHIYDNHKEAVKEQLVRDPLQLPELEINDTPFAYLEAGEDFDNFIAKLTVEDFQLIDYKSHPAIKAPLSTGLKL